MNSSSEIHKSGVMRFLPPPRIWKTALAAVIAWEIAQRLGSAHPFFAPLASILCMQATVERSIRKGFQRVIGIVIGVILASLLIHIAGAEGWSIGLLILTGLGLGHVLRLPEYSFTQIGVSALLVLTVGTDSSYGFDRLMETVIGAASAIVVNMLIIPPDYSRKSENELRDTAERLSRYLNDLSEWIRRGADVTNSSSLRQAAVQVRKKILLAADGTEQALHALKFSPFLSRRRKRLESQRQRLSKLELGCLHALEIQSIAEEYSRSDTLQLNERERWGRGLSELASRLHDRNKADLADARSFLTEEELTELTTWFPVHSGDYGGALQVTANRLLRELSAAPSMGDICQDEAQIAFGHLSDGRSHGHDLAEN